MVVGIALCFYEGLGGPRPAPSESGAGSHSPPSRSLRFLANAGYADLLGEWVSSWS